MMNLDKLIFTWDNLYAHRLLRILGFRRLRSLLEETIDTFAPGCSASERNRHRKGIKNAYINYNWMLKEYFWYHFDQISESQKNSIVSDREMHALYKSVNSKKARALFTDKYATYKLFYEFYKRGVCKCLPENTSDFESFLQDNPRFIVKPLDSLCGRGIKIFDFSKEGPDFVLKAMNRVLSEYKTGFVAEGLIIQSPEMAVLHPSSVNTLRINTVRYEDYSEVIAPCVRMGRGGNIVDNAGSGGIFAAVDKATGVTTHACDESCHTFTCHPDTGVDLIGFQVPHWEDAVRMALKLSEILPENHITGWDLAYTDDGWVMVEGNTRPLFMYQIATQIGLRPEIDRIKNNLSDIIQ